MKARSIGFVASVLVGVAYSAGPMWVGAQSLVSGQEASAVVAIADLKVINGEVSGLLVNKSAHRVRNVRLLIRHTWLWNDERHPGADDPGRAVYVTVPKDVAAGHAEPFMYAPEPPLPRRSDGHFDTSVEVVGFTEVGE